MTKNVVSRVDRNLARRLREARREAGLSTRAVAKKMPSRWAVSHTALARYENGVSTPPVDVLAVLADIYGRTINWFLESRECLTGFRYRNLQARVSVPEQRKFEALAGKWIDAYVNLEQHLRQPKTARAFDLRDDRSPQTMAESVRRTFLNLDDTQPIQCTVAVLELFSAWALEVRASFGVDGATAWHGNDFVVVLNPTVANDRLRMNAAHELAYLIYAECKNVLGLPESQVEKRSYDFASAFLLPETQLRAAFDGHSFLKLIQYKEKFGISLVAMIHTAEKAKIITTTTSRWLRSEMFRRGWRNHEPGYVWRDRAISFETMLECAIQTKALTWLDAERITGIRENELRQRLDDVTNRNTEGGDEPSTLKLIAP